MSTPSPSTAERDRELAQAHADLQRAMADVRRELAVLEEAARQYGKPAKLDVIAGQVAVLSRELAQAAVQVEVLNEQAASAVVEEETR